MRDEPPDVVLLDVNMPEMNGYQFLERAHDHANGAVSRKANVPIVVLTSAILDTGERSLLHRASRIMSKSDLSAGTLIDAIEHALHPARSVLAE